MPIIDIKPKITDEKSFLKYRDWFLRNHVPKEYNQLELTEELFNEEIVHYISISNRRDGKSFNYVHFFMNFAIETDVAFSLICRNWTVKALLQDFVRRVAEKSNSIKSQDIQFQRGDFFTYVFWKDKRIGLITDLNAATNLKYASNFLEEFPIIIYDEFLALEGDYLPDEFERLSTIYSSINRGEPKKFIVKPKVFYLGNAVNFSSPILSGLELFNIIEKHPINTMKQYEDLLLEMRRNDNANEKAGDDPFERRKNVSTMNMGRFKINNYRIANEKERSEIMRNPKFIYIKLDKEYLKITYNLDNRKILLSLTNYADDYTFNLKLKDNKKSATYLNETYYDSRHYKKYEKGLFLFDNNYSKDMITNNFSNLEALKINKIILKHESSIRERTEFERNEEVYEENYIERTKKAIFNKFK